MEEDDAYEGDERTIFTLTYVDSSDVAAGLIGSAVSIVNRTAHYTSDCELSLSLLGLMAPKLNLCCR